MYNDLGLHIKQKISQHNISIHVLEKRAGLKQGAIQNIIYGRSKNPTISLIKSIADALGCSIDVLLSNQPSQSQIKNFAQESIEKNFEHKVSWNQNLYFECQDLVKKVVSQKKLLIQKDKMLDIADEIYNFAIFKKNNHPDEKFLNYLLEKVDP